MEKERKKSIEKSKGNRKRSDSLSSIERSVSHNKQKVNSNLEREKQK